MQWAMADLATLRLGAIVVPIYPTLMANQVEYILRDSEPVAIFCSNAEQVAKIDEIKGSVPSLRNVISFEPVVGVEGQELGAPPASDVLGSLLEQG